jgi:methylenetetrahydrofolate reductase (NADPH)
MIRKIADILKDKGEAKTLSFEFFPPKTEAGRQKLPEIARAYLDLKPDWLAVTYGAGGTTRDWTTPIVDDFQRRFDIPVVHHFTCVGHNQAEIQGVIDELVKRNIRNILALRGDPPVGVAEWKSSPGGFEYCYQLIKVIGENGDFFSVGVAGFPEGHITTKDVDLDIKFLKTKLAAGGDFIMTQLFYDNDYYFNYVKKVRAAGINIRIIPGIMPIPNYQALLKFTANCGASIPKRVREIFERLDADEEASYRAGVDFAVAQCQELLDGGAPGLHFFTMNRINPAIEIVSRLKIQRC